MSDEIASVAYEARNRADAAHDKMDSHERLCAERYMNINKSIDDLKTGLKWLAGLLLSVLIAVSGWSLTQQVSTVNQKQELFNQQLVRMVERETRRQAEQPPPTQPTGK